MFYTEDENGKVTIENILDDIEIYKNNRFLHENNFKSLSHLVNLYHNREEYINELLNKDDFNNIVSLDVKSQIVELFENVKNALISEDKSILDKCIEQIYIGKENVMKFIDEQSGYLDDKIRKIMNVILDEYSYHIKYLGEAIEILNEN